MRKLLLVLVVLLLASCSKDDCNCIKETYTIVYDSVGDYSLELSKKEYIDCTDEISYRDYISDNLIVIKCY
jgi:uncharacterized protein YcfL